MPENIQGQIGWGFDQPDLVIDGPAYCKRAGLHNRKMSLPIQTIL